MTDTEILTDLREQIGWARTHRDYGPRGNRTGWQIEIDRLALEIKRVQNKTKDATTPQTSQTGTESKEAAAQIEKADQ